MCQGACAPEFFRFRHPRRAEDAHSAFHWWCLWQCAAFGLSATRWCRRPVLLPTIDLEVQNARAFQVFTPNHSANFATVLVQLLGLVHFLRHTIEGVCFPPTFSARTVRRSSVGVQPSFLSNHPNKQRDSCKTDHWGTSGAQKKALNVEFVPRRSSLGQISRTGLFLS